jgi:hypothetical protein
VQKYLLGKPCDMAAIARCDMTGDVIVDGFDYAVLKRMILINKS